MPFQSYLKKYENLLIDFEKSQLKMLKLNLGDAGDDFLNQIIEMRQFFKQVSNEIVVFTFKTEREKTLLTKQIERLLVFLKEMELHIAGFFANSSPGENEILFIFERQHLFKNIYRKHLSDLASITSE
jgi:hypothetical protein